MRMRKTSCIYMYMSGKRPPVVGFLSALSTLRGCFPFKKVLRSSFRELPSYDDRQFYFEGELETLAVSGAGGGNEPFVLRLSNLMFSVELINGFNAVMQHLSKKGINCSQPLTSRSGRHLEMINGRDLDPEGRDLNQYPVRVLKFIPGTMMNELETKYLTSGFLYSVGHFAGKVDAALQDFSHPAIDSFVNECWDLQYFSSLKKYIPYLNSEWKTGVADTVMALYEDHLLPKLTTMKRGVVHGDLNGRNIVCQVEKQQVEIIGLIDFGDCVCTCYMFELATLVSHTMMNREDPIGFVAPVIRGYLDVFALSQNELQGLFYAVLALLCTSAVKGQYNLSMEPENTHIQRDIEHAWKLLSFLLTIPKDNVDLLWNIQCS